MIINHTRGIGTQTSHREGEYFGDDFEIPVFEDMTEFHEFKKGLIDQRNQIQANLKELEQLKLKREKEEAEKKKLEASKPSQAPQGAENGDAT